jgi:hypothetical protein
MIADSSDVKYIDLIATSYLLLRLIFNIYEFGLYDWHNIFSEFREGSFATFTESSESAFM